MGGARFSNVDWQQHKIRTQSMSRDEIFTSSDLHPDLDPSKIPFREARDSAANPESTPIILASDVTGSMGVVAETIIKESLGEIMNALYDRKPVTDPAIACMAIGDANCDRAPLQVTQFESSSTPLVEQLAKVYVEGGGGGNGGESYPLAWAFTAYKTKVDCIWKRHRKGYLFTIGDECALPTIRKEHLRHFLGMEAPEDMDAAVLLADLQKDWHVFHLMVNPVRDQPVEESWKKLLPERALLVRDLKQLAPGIVAVIQMMEGATADAATAGWDGNAAVVVRDVVQQLVRT